MALVRWVGRAIGLDVHRDFCVVAICEDGKVRSAGRVPSTPEGLRLLAESLLATDRVALEVTASCWEVARILEPFVDRVVVVSPDDTGICERAGEDRQARRAHPGGAVVEGRARSRSGCPMSAAGSCAAGSRAASSSCTRARAPRTRSQAVLARRLIERPPFADLFGVTGRRWLAEVRAARRGARVRRRGSAADRVPRRRDQGGREADRPAGAGLAGDPPVDDRAGREPDLRRDVHRRDRRALRFLTTAGSSRISGWIRRSANPARHRPGRAGSPSAGRRPRGGRWSRRRGAWSSSPDRCARSTSASARGGGTARRSSRPPASSRSCSGACSPAGEDYAHQRPALTKKKLRELELTAGAKPRTKDAAGIWSTNRAIRDAERALTEQAEVSYQRMVTDQQAGRPSRKVGASATPERA